MNQLEQAIVSAAEFGGAPPRTFQVGPDADVEFSATAQALQITHWTRD